MTDISTPFVPASPGAPNGHVPAGAGTPGTPPGTASLTKLPLPPADTPEAPPKRVPVDPPGLPGTGVFTEKRRPIVPGWARSRANFTAETKRLSTHAWYATRYHGVRLITGAYAFGLLRYAPAGAARFARGTRSLVWDGEAAPLRAVAVANEDFDEYRQLRRLQRDRVRLRGLLAAVACVLGIALAFTLYVVGPGWLYLAAGLCVLALGWFGQPKDAPVIGPAVLRTEVEKLTHSIVLRGLNAIGNSKITAAIRKGGEMDGMRFTHEISRDGPGYLAELDLPYGVTPDDVMEERKALASGLRRKLGCVWPSGDEHEHEGHLKLFVADRPMNETKRPAWPLAKDGQVDLFKPIVFGNDQRMRWVSVTLMFASVVIGAIPRMGKTFLLRLLLLIAALDPRAQILAFDFKGTGDLGPLEPVCHAYRAGDEDEDVLYVLHALREVKTELRRRAKVVKSLPRKRCPENKVTPDLANDKSLGLHPIVIGMDETQVPFEHEKYGPELESICTDIAKRGPALGIVGMFATQRPDAKSLPPGITNNAVLRFALKVMGHTANDMILGTGMYKAGIRATMFSRSDLGICWMSGEGDDPRIVCGTFVDAPAAERIVQRARVLREEYGNVTGHAIGEEPAAGAGLDILGDVRSVTAADEDKVWCERIAARLAELRPDVYGEWKGESVTAALKPWGIKTDQVWGTDDDGTGRNRRGVARADILAAITRRDADRRAA